MQPDCDSSAANIAKNRVGRKARFCRTQGDCYLPIFAALITGLAVSATAWGDAVGRLNGTFGVSPRGAATYQVSISVPPGVNGLQPNIAITYNSQGSDGPLGWGWSLSGFSRIDRCGKTWALDGQRTGVMFTSQDRFCLDGQPLVMVTGSSYGADGTEYRKELHNHEKIIAHGTAGSGPNHFEVKQPNGLTYWYGQTADSRFEQSAASSTVRSWAVNKIEDKYGNAVIFSYNENVSSGEHDPAEIRWSESPSTSSRYKLIFTYESQPRPDTRSGFIFGAQWTRSKRLEKVVLQFDNSLVHEYRFKYRDSPGVSQDTGSTGRSKLASVQQCGPTSCLPSTSFDWWLGDPGWAAVSTSGPGTSGGNEYHKRAAYGDYNGDGRVDILAPDGAPATFRLVLTTSSGNFPATPVDTGVEYYHAECGSSPPYCAYPPSPASLEFDGDGRADLLAVKSVSGGWRWYVYRSNGTGAAGASFDAPIDTEIAWAPVDGAQMTALDVNGDGLDDLVYSRQGSMKLQLNSGGAFPGVAGEIASGIAAGSAYSGRTRGMRPADFNGDGRADLLVLYSINGSDFTGEIHLSTGTNFSGQTIATNIGKEVITPDVNGDGLSDVVDDSGVRLSRGDSLAPVAAGIQTCLSTIVTDYDDDGRDDLVCGSGTNWHVYTSDGATYDANRNYPVSAPSGGFDQTLRALDVTGDGLRDLVWTQTVNQATWLVAPHAASYPRADVVNRMDDGLGNYHNIVYGPLTNPAVYQVSAPPNIANSFTRLIAGQAFFVVDKYTTNDGAGDSYDVEYTYRNAFRETKGRGFLGFSYVLADDSRTGAPSRETLYSLPFPYTGRPVQDKITAGSTVTSLTIRGWNQYEQVASADPAGANAKYRFVYMPGEQTDAFELGTTTSFLTTARTLTYSDSGPTSQQGVLHGTPNQELIQISAGGQSWTTTRVFNFDDDARTTSWCLGLPTEVSETRSSPDAPGSETRKVGRTYNLTKCTVATETLLGRSDTPATKQLKTWFYYTPETGNLNRRDHNAVQSSLSNRVTYFGYDPGQYRLAWESQVIEEEQTGCGGIVTSPGVSLVTNYTWDNRFGLIATEESPQKLTTQWTYDPFGRLIKEDPLWDANQTDMVYADCDSACDFALNGEYQVISTRAGAVDFVARTVHDPYGRMVGRAQVMMNGQVSQQATVFDARGRMSSEEALHFAGQSAVATSYVHDDLDRVITMTRPVNAAAGGTAITEYDYNGLSTTITETSAQSRQTTLLSDPWGNLKQVTNGQTPSASYLYTDFGELTQITDPAGHVSSFGVDGRGLTLSRTDADTGTTSFDHDAFGALIKETYQAGNAVEYQFDRVGRLVNRLDRMANGTVAGSTAWIFLPSGPGYSNNGQGLLDRVETGGYFSESYVYDTDALPTTVTTTLYGGTPYITARTYDAFGRLATMTYPGAVGGYPTYQYHYTDESGSGLARTGDLYQVTQDTGFGPSPLYSVTAVDALGRVTGSRFGSEGPYETYTYNSRDQLLASIQTGTSQGATDIQNYEYQWNNTGTLAWRKDLTQGIGITEDFSYDSLDRLETAQRNQLLTLNLTYTPDGNIDTKSGVGTYSYGGTQNRHAVTSIAGPRPSAYAYDANGNLTCRGASVGPPCPAGQQINWTPANYPEAIYRDANDYVALTYGPDRQRVRQTIFIDGTATTTNRYVGRHFEAEFTPDDTLYRSYVFFGARMVYSRRSSIETGSLSEYYVHQDHLGSVDRLTHLIDGQIDRHYSFDAFGKRRNTTWTDDASDSLMADTALQWTERGYTGHEHLDPVKLIHMNGRVQDPILGRMISADPLLGDLTDPQSLNRYSYVRNNPLALTDPSGFASCTEPEQGPLTCEVTSGGDRDEKRQMLDSYVNSWSVFKVDMDDVGDQSSAWQKQSSVDAGASNNSPGAAFPDMSWAIPTPSALARKGVTEAGKFTWSKLFSYLRSIFVRSSSSARAAGILRDAARGKGNFGLGSGTRAEAERLGRAWVGDGAKVASDGKTLISADGLRQFRPPSFKPNLGIEQANFEQRLVPSGQWFGNGHLDIGP